MQTTEPHKKKGIAAIIIITLGINLSTTLSESAGSLGTVLIAIGGFVLISAMAQKRKQDKQKKCTNSGNTN